MDAQQRERLQQQAPQTYARVDQGQPLQLADIKAMARAGVSGDIIISQIQNTHSAYRLSAADIIDLHNSGVSDRVVNYMINTPNTAGAAPSSTVVVQQPPPPPPAQTVVVAPAPAMCGWTETGIGTESPGSGWADAGFFHRILTRSGCAAAGIRTARVLPLAGSLAALTGVRVHAATVCGTGETFFSATV